MYENNYLVHYGIKGMRWGVRRFQNEDGSLTRAGKRRLANEIYKKKTKKADDDILLDLPNGKTKLQKFGQGAAKVYNRTSTGALKRRMSANREANKIYKEQKTPKQKMSKGKKAAAVTLGVAGGLIAADYISAKVTGQPNLTQTVNMLIQTVKFGG